MTSSAALRRRRIDHEAVVDLGQTTRQRRADGAVLRREQLDRSADRVAVDRPTVDHVEDVDPGQRIRMVVLLRAACQHPVAGDHLALLAQDGDDVHRGAAGDRHRDQLRRRMSMSPRPSSSTRACPLPDSATKRRPSPSRVMVAVLAVTVVSSAARADGHSGGDAPTWVVGGSLRSSPERPRRSNGWRGRSRRSARAVEPLDDGRFRLA